jgi:hypothetical protein
VPSLTTESLDVRGRQALDADPAEGLLHLVETMRLHDRDDELHGRPFVGRGD